MSWPRGNRGIGRFLALGLAFACAGLSAGCFQPLYGNSSLDYAGAPPPVRTALASVHVEEIDAPNGTPEARLGVEVRNALQAIDSAERGLAAAGSARRGAEEQYASEQRRFESGLSTVFLVLQRQTALVEAKAQEVRAKADLARALSEYDRSTGTILERYGVAVEP